MINIVPNPSKSKSSFHFTEQLGVDVLIAGAGPTGSTLAADLLRRGLRVRIVDKSPHAFKGSRAKGVQPRTQEVFEDLGILGEAHNEGGPTHL
ncbi:FAD-dependent monooxygenase [Bacillus sp. TH11]|nr:FAD-dependent monooxygenase [Bacillus sp. TH11]